MHRQLRKRFDVPLLCGTNESAVPILFSFRAFFEQNTQGFCCSLFSSVNRRNESVRQRTVQASFALAKRLSNQFRCVVVYGNLEGAGHQTILSLPQRLRHSDSCFVASGTSARPAEWGQPADSSLSGLPPDSSSQPFAAGSLRALFSESRARALRQMSHCSFPLCRSRSFPDVSTGSRSLFHGCHRRTSLMVARESERGSIPQPVCRRLRRAPNSNYTATDFGA